MWTTPHDWAAADKPTASRMNLVRDNLRLLYQPPTCRLSGVGSQPAAKDANSNTDWTIVDWPNTIVDNDGMRSLSGTGQNEPAGGFVETQTAGHYLASSVLAFDHAVPPDPYVAPPYLERTHTLAVSVRASYTSGRYPIGYASDGPAGDWRTSVVPVVAAWASSPGYQWFVEVYAPETAGPQLLIRDGRIPYFYLTWIGGS